MNMLPDTLVFVLWVSITLLILALLGLGSILLRRLFQATDEKVRNKHRDLFMKWVIGCVHADVVGEVQVKENYLRRLKFFSQGSYPRIILMEVFANYIKNLNGVYRQYLIQLYDRLGLTEPSYQKIYSRNFYTILQGLKEIKEFHLGLKDEDFNHLMNHPKKEVREESFYLLFHLSKDPWKFLMDSNFTLSLWQKILIYEQFKKMSVDQIPDMTRLLQTTNHKNLMFFLSVIGRLKLNQYQFTLIKLLNLESSDLVRKQILKVLSVIGDHRAVRRIKHWNGKWSLAHQKMADITIKRIEKREGELIKGAKIQLVTHHE